MIYYVNYFGQNVTISTLHQLGCLFVEQFVCSGTQYRLSFFGLCILFFVPGESFVYFVKFFLSSDHFTLQVDLLQVDVFDLIQEIACQSVSYMIFT